MKKIAIFVLVVFLGLGCNDPEEEFVWPDGSRLWVGGVYADSALSWSPYGDVLFFSTYVLNATRLFGTDGLAEPEGRTFTSNDEFMGPLGAWNAENGRIVYAALNSDSLWGQIRSIPGNNTNATIHVHDSLFNTFPTYTITGDSILYCSQTIGGFRLFKIDALRTTDSTQAPVLQEGFPVGDILRPSYSPETGNRILFQHRSTESDDWDIMVADQDGSNQKIISQNSADDIHPTWGPDDEWIAFASDRTGDFDIYLANVLTDSVIHLTNDPSMDLYPAWNPRKNWIAFSSDRASGNWNLDIFAIDEPTLP